MYFVYFSQYSLLSAVLLGILFLYTLKSGNFVVIYFEYAIFLALQTFFVTRKAVPIMLDLSFPHISLMLLLDLMMFFSILSASPLE